MRSTRKYFMIAVIGVLVSCATLPENIQREASTGFPDTHDTGIGRRVQAEMQMHPGESGYLLLGNGLDAFVARALLAQFAERSIDTQFYMIHDDVVGSLFVDPLNKAAERGVRVRLRVEDIDQENRINAGLRLGLGFTGGLFNSNADEKRENYGVLGLDLTRIEKTTLFSGWGVTPAVYHNWTNPEDNDQTSFGLDVHVNLLKNRVRISLGARDSINDANDTVFLTIGIADLLGLFYWMSR